MRYITIVAAMLYSFAFSANAADIGKPAPDFSVNDINGAVESISQYKGKIVVLEWNNPGCPFVHKHYDSGNMQKLQQYAQDKGVVWLTINSGAEGKQGYMTADEAIGYVKKQNALPSVYILDPQGMIGHMYDAKSTPHMFVIDANGMLAYGGAIDDMPSVDQADIAKSKNYVKAAIDDLLAGRAVKTPKTQAYGCSVKYKG